ncbi:50S ribosomal protein L17 [bacterium Unc6]|nr:50S ribosomal protein L17 [bacterium Unc6]
MRHRKDNKRLSRTTGHRTAMVRNMATSLFENEKITTTVQKAKFSRRFIEKLITFGKKNTLAARRMTEKMLGKKNIVHMLFSEVAPLFANRQGGYTRIVKSKFRAGDGAQLCVFELVEKRQKSIEQPEQAVDKKTVEKHPTQPTEEKKGAIKKIKRIFHRK